MAPPARARRARRDGRARARGGPGCGELGSDARGARRGPAPPGPRRARARAAAPRPGGRARAARGGGGRAGRVQGVPARRGPRVRRRARRGARVPGDGRGGRAPDRAPRRRERGGAGPRRAPPPAPRRDRRARGGGIPAGRRRRDRGDLVRPRPRRAAVGPAPAARLSSPADLDRHDGASPPGRLPPDHPPPPRCGARGGGHGARLRADHPAAPADGDRPRRRRTPRRGLAREQAQGAREPHVAHAPLRPRALRPRGRARLQRPRARRRLRAHPGRQHLRLRVRRPAAQHRLPPGPPRDDAGRDPAPAARALRGRPRQARAVRGAQGGVLPGGLRGRPGRARRARRRPRADRGDRAPAARRLALPPQVEPPVPARARAPRAPRGRLGGGDPAHGRAARARPAARAAVGDRAGGGRGRAEPDRARRPRRLGRRHHEPRGGRARNAGLHDLRRAARRRRRAPHPRRPAAAADRRARDRGRQATRRAHDRPARSGRAGRHDPRCGGVTQAAATPMSQTSYETLVDRYARMAHTFQPRPVDRVLRVVDIVLASAGLVVSSPLMALCALAVRLSGSRGVLYRGARVGRGGRIFTMVKFRTLKPEAETRIGPFYGEELTRLTETEQTRVGRLLRASKLDELPQLWNVLRGDMSIVGPRPIRPLFFEGLAQEIPAYWQRLVVPPGITGFAQLRLTREITWAEKLAHDFEYIADRSVRLYFEVVAETVWLVLSRPLKPPEN